MENVQPSISNNTNQLQMQHMQTSLDEADNIHHVQIDTFIHYKPPKLRSGLPHPDEVVETLSLSSVSSPEIRYNMAIPDDLVDSGKVSSLQLEAALYACQAHLRFLPSGERIGYLIGDGAGVGKGRTIATIIYENYLRGRRKAIWLSVSSDLKFDAERDLSDIGASKIRVYALNKLKYMKISDSVNGSINRGVIFVTYSSLIGECHSDVPKECQSRLKQLIQWCGKDFDGLIVFDECHRAKNLCPTSGTRSTKTGRVVLELQQALPGARVVYASATGATEPRNMAYMTRLGLWGRGLTFETFSDFIHAVENRGVGAMEMVAMDMKLRGLYLSRQLSFRGADFLLEEVPLTLEFINMYDESVKLWMECRRQFARALKHIPENKVGRQNIWARFWAAHQRFFKYLCINAKVDACVRIALQAIRDKKCVVIGLQSTGESQTLDFLEENGEVTEFVSTAKSVIQTLVENHFPIHDDVSAIDDFQRMFLNNVRCKRGLDSLDHKIKPGKRARMSYSMGAHDKLSAERESGGNSEYEEDNCSETSSGCDEDEESATDQESEDDGKSDAEEEQELERLLVTSQSERHSISQDINPFCVDLAEEDPWANVQRKAEKESQNFSNHQPLTEDKFIKETDKGEKKRNKRQKLRQETKQKRNFILAAASNIKCTTNAEHFMQSTNVVGHLCQDDEDDTINLTEIKTNLLAAVDRLGRILPPNTLDSLINLLGGPKFVAEMTGRKGRIVANEGTGDVGYELRTADSDSSLEMMNMVEKDKFMRGEKLVAIISEAASSGISLQSDKRSQNRRRRVHITLELPWSADKAVQQFGRTHRSNQESAPEYLFLISELAGEKRFASIVAKRLESLGALTQGDRRAAESRDLGQFNVENIYGREALDLLLKTLVGAISPVIPPPADYGTDDFFKDMQIYLESVGMLQATHQGFVVERDTATIPKFLNRILGLPVFAQNKLFQYFTDICNELVKQAKVDGTFDLGILDLGMDNDRVQKVESRKFSGAAKSGEFIVEMHKISLLRSVSWEKALQLSGQHRGPFDGFYTSPVGPSGKRSVAFIFGMGIGAASNTTSTGMPRHYCITRPNTGRSPKYETINDIKQRFRSMPVDEAGKLWNEQFKAFGQVCHHKYFFGKCSTEQKGTFCEMGRRMRTYFVLSGSLISVWPELEALLSDGSKGKRLRRMQIVRVRTDNSQRIVGVLVMPNYVVRLIKMLEERCGGIGSGLAEQPTSK